MNISKSSSLTVVAAAIMALVIVILTALRAVAATPCEIPNSACYPWRIAPGSRETTLLNIVPNNAITGAIYRICLCPPSQSVELVFRFGTDDVVIGHVAGDNAGPVCRDFRFETSRRSKLVLRRAQTADGPLAGCYVTAPVGP
jgi:hypothetical protein